MKRQAGYLVEKLTAGRDISLPSEKFRLGMIEGWTSIAANLILTLIKFTMGLLTGSVALLADAAHTASDISSSLAVLVGFHLSRKKPDRDHPYGHGRIEYFTGLVIAIMLVAAGITFIYTAIVNFIGGSVLRPSLPALLAIILSVFVKNLMYHFSMQLGKMIQSDALIGDAWHHRSDALTSSAVMVALLGSYFNLHWLDSVLGLAIALLVIHAGLKVAKNSIDQLLGAAPDPQLQEEIINCARKVRGVLDAHDLAVHDYGFVKSITLHIEVDGSMTVHRAHEIAASVELQISRSYHCNAVVQLDPRENGGRINSPPAQEN